MAPQSTQHVPNHSGGSRFLLPAYSLPHVSFCTCSRSTGSLEPCVLDPFGHLWLRQCSLLGAGLVQQFGRSARDRITVVYRSSHHVFCLPAVSHPWISQANLITNTVAFPSGRALTRKRDSDCFVLMDTVISSVTTSCVIRLPQKSPTFLFHFRNAGAQCVVTRTDSSQKHVVTMKTTDTCQLLRVKIRESSSQLSQHRRASENVSVPTLAEINPQRLTRAHALAQRDLFSS